MPDKHEVGGSSPLGPTRNGNRKGSVPQGACEPMIEVSLPSFLREGGEKTKSCEKTS